MLIFTCEIDHDHESQSTKDFFRDKLDKESGLSDRKKLGRLEELFFFSSSTCLVREHAR